jgi:Brp/Blh family beta-carotene 15,15'-monooxygenase
MNFWQKSALVASAIALNYLIESETVIFAIAGFFVLLLGIPHGASDPIIYNFIDRRKLSVKASPTFLLTYVVFIVVYLGLWIVFPRLSLIFFLLISSFHFGETQLINATNEPLKKYALSFTWGTAVLSMLLLSHLDVLAGWLMPIVQSQHPFMWLESHKWIVITVSISLSLVAIATVKPHLLLKESSELVLLTLLFTYTDILIGFSIFFCFWHSWDALELQLRGLRQIDKNLKTMHFVRKILPYSLMSIAAMIVFTVLSIALKLELSWIIVFFVLVALLTLPHSIIISRFYQKIGSN